MLTTKKVIEDAIKVREDELFYLKELYLPISDLDEETTNCNIESLESQIAELKQNLQDVFEAHNKRQSLV